MRQRRYRITRAVVMAALSLIVAGCGNRGVKLYPVKGKVLFQEKPADGASVVFQPVGAAPGPDTLMASGRVGPDGSFSLQTFSKGQVLGEGAPPGEYIVLVTWYPPDARGLENAVNRLPAKYADQSAGLLKATVKEGLNELAPFRLTR